MVEGKQRDQWIHTTKIYLLLANVYRDEKVRKKPYEFDEVYPFKLPKIKKKRDIPDAPISALKVFLKNPRT